jgi:L-fuculose-phosphate aldolase
VTEAQICEDIVEAGRRLHEKNMLASADGNISYRLADDRILITPTGISKSFLKPEQLAIITLDNRIVQGNPSSERLMHLEAYKACPQAKCVVHAHPPTAIAWSIARPYLTELPSDCLPEVLLAVGRIPIVPYARPGMVEMGTNLRRFLCKHRVMILARHGGLSWGESVMEAYNGIERLEHCAHILKLAQDMGGLPSLPASELVALQALRRKLGDRTL